MAKRAAGIFAASKVSQAHFACEANFVAHAGRRMHGAHPHACVVYFGKLREPRSFLCGRNL